MKYLILILASLLFLSGCVGNNLEHWYTDDAGNDCYLRVKSLRGSCNAKAKNGSIEFADGTKIKFDSFDYTADPNSATALGEGIHNAASAFTLSDVLKDDQKGNDDDIPK